MIQDTTDYTKFEFIKENRKVNLASKECRKLAHMMKMHGWIDACPAIVQKYGAKLIVKDGQHRIAVAKSLGIPAKYVVMDLDIDIAELNSWSIADYVHRYMAQDNEHYNTLWAFHNRYGLSLSTCAELLSGAYYSGALLKDGGFVVTNTANARSVAEMATYLKGLNPAIALDKVVRAISACLKVEEFDKGRLLEKAEKSPQLLRSATGTRSAVLEVIEQIYNHGNQKRLNLKFLAEEAERMARSA